MSNTSKIKKTTRFVCLAIILTTAAGCMSSYYVRETYFSAINLEEWKKAFLYGGDVYVFKSERSKLLLLPTVLDQDQVADSLFYQPVNKSKYKPQEKNSSKEYFTILDYKKNLNICHTNDLLLTILDKSVSPYKIKKIQISRNKERCVYYFPMKAYELTEFTLNFNEQSMGFKVSPITLKIDSRTYRKSNPW